MPDSPTSATSPAQTTAGATRPATLLDDLRSTLDATDVRLVALDMDGSLLDSAKRLPDGFRPVLDALVARGVTVCPASGRQHATLRAQLGRGDLTYVAENGAVVVRDDEPVAVAPLDRATARRAVGVVRDAVADGADLGAVLCGVRSAYVERTDEAFLAHVRPYYRLLEHVEDLQAVDDDVLKLAVFDFGAAEQGAGPLLAPFDGPVRVLVSGQHWVDVMGPDADKGTAVRALQARLGIAPEQTMAFGDYFNDLGMLAAAGWSFAMANGHPDVRAAARFVAPSNDDDGVVRTLRAAFRLDG
ncbi:Cof-type HAD-IIB family hydrolase [Cellulomonas palmilytica]|uniref:Cof-type HAD-IIB family hydrolase n=1 Tax=Cellulomonas palmilytica TaxID=2608402 RepID=UPI00294FFF22|nr:HAD family hydrolase [Cellulomonas palmilytica]